MKKAAVPVSEYFDAILALVETGLTIKQVCASDPKFPMHASVYDFISRKPERKARLQESYRVRDVLLAGQGKKAPHRHFTEADFDAALAAIQACTAADIMTVLVPPLPPYEAIGQRARREPAFNVRYRKAMDSRDNPRLIKDASFEQAVHLIKSSQGVSLKAIFAKHDLGMTLGGYQQRVKDKHLPRLRKGKPRGLEPKVKPVYRTNVLSSALRLNDIYAVVEKAVPRSYEPADRDDIMSEMVVALLDGTISVEEAKTGGLKFARQFLNPQRRQWFQSLDIGGHQDFAWVDNLSTDAATWVAE